VTRFREGAGQDLTDVASRAILADFTGGCEPGTEEVTVDLNLILAAEKGPALQGDRTDYRYFVAVADAQGTVLAKEEFDTTVAFPAGQSRAGTVEEIGAGRKPGTGAEGATAPETLRQAGPQGEALWKAGLAGGRDGPRAEFLSDGVSRGLHPGAR
jgi:hypothetical protein